MKLIFTLLFCFSFLLINAQQTKPICSKTASKFKKEKSNTLPINYIKETEKYDVTFYELDIVATNTNTNLKGIVKMTAIANENLDSVVFELFPSYTIKYILIDSDTAKYSWRNTGIHCKTNIKKGQTFTITTNYSGSSPDKTTNPLGGAGYTSEQSQTWKKHVSWTLSEPFSAYEWMPCKQSLKDKIDSVKIAITVPDSCMAGSNGTLQKVTSLPGNQKRFEWKHNNPIDYYLISFSVANYVDYSIYAHPKNADSILIQNYVYPNSLNYFKDLIDNTAKFIEYYSEIYTLYPFHKEKYGHCMAPISGGMEHQTMTTLGYFDNELVAHELAHQWWGDHVTCGSWSDIWLNEGFATYSEYLTLAKLFPGEEKNKLDGFHSSVLSQLNGSTWCKDSLNQNSIFSRRLVYDKGAAIIHTLRHIINNDSLFFKALQNYQTEFAFSTATAKDFKKSVENTTKIDLTPFFNEWYYGEGYPTYSAKIQKNIDNSFILMISQKTSAPSITPLFTTPIEIQVSRTNKSDTILRIPITSNNQKAEFPAEYKLKEVTNIDPNNFIVNQIEQFTTSLDTMKDNLFIYPNPTTDLLYIELKNPSNTTLKLISMDGKLILENSFTKEMQVDMRTQSPGNYLLILENEHSTYQQKITKN